MQVNDPKRWPRFAAAKPRNPITELLKSPERWPAILRYFFYPPTTQTRQTVFFFRAGLWLLVLYLTITIFRNGADAGIVYYLHNLNLPIHEAGHIVFGIFGSDLIKSMGGTLFQIIMPLVCFLALFIKTRDLFGSSLALWWAFENFIDIAPYAADARAGELPLIGENYGSEAPYGFHDWNFILNELHVLEYDTQVAHIAYIIGYTGMTLCLLWGLWTLIYVKVFQKDELSI